VSTVTSSQNVSRILQQAPAFFDGHLPAALRLDEPSLSDPDILAIREARRYLEVCEQALATEEARAEDQMLSDPQYLQAKQDFEKARRLAECALVHSKRGSGYFVCIGSLSTACLLLLVERSQGKSWIDRLCARMLHHPRLIELRSMFARRAAILQEYAQLCDKRADHFEEALTAIEMQRYYLPAVIQTRKDHTSALSRYESLVRQCALRATHFPS